MNINLESSFNDHQRLIDEFDRAASFAAKAQQKCRTQFYALVQGQGTGPDLAQLNATENMAREALDRWQAVSGHLKSVLFSQGS